MKAFSSAVIKVRNSDGNFETVPALRGATSYEVAVRNGFEGTEDEWVSMMLDDGWVAKCLELEQTKADKDTTYTKDEIDAVISLNGNTLSNLVIEKWQMSHTWIAPKAVGQIFRVFCVGAGGTGGKAAGAEAAASNNRNCVGGGGGGGGHISIADLHIAEGTPIDIICGAVSSEWSAKGGKTSFGTLLEADGGEGGGSPVINLNSNGNISEITGNSHGGSGGSGGGGGDTYMNGTNVKNYERGNGGNGSLGGGGGCSRSGSTTGGAGGTHGGNGGDANNPGDTEPIYPKVILIDALFDPDKLPSSNPLQNTVPLNGNSGIGGEGGTKGGDRSGGGGGGFCSPGGNGACKNVSGAIGGGGGGGGGYFGAGGNAFSGNEADGSMTGSGGGGGGFFFDGGNASTKGGGTGGGFFSTNGGVLIMYSKEDDSDEV